MWMPFFQLHIFVFTFFGYSEKDLHSCIDSLYYAYFNYIFIRNIWESISALIQMNLYSVTHGYNANKNDHKMFLSILSND